MYEIKIKILTRSIRPNKFNIQPVVWMYELDKKEQILKQSLWTYRKLIVRFLMYFRTLRVCVS